MVHNSAPIRILSLLGFLFFINSLDISNRFREFKFFQNHQFKESNIIKNLSHQTILFNANTKKYSSNTNKVHHPSFIFFNNFKLRYHACALALLNQKHISFITSYQKLRFIPQYLTTT